MYSLWDIYKEKPSYLVNQMYSLLRKWNLILIFQIINIEKPLQSPWQVAQLLTGEQLKALFKWHSLFYLQWKRRKDTDFLFIFGNLITI